MVLTPLLHIQCQVKGPIEVDKLFKNELLKFNFLFTFWEYAC